MSRNLGAKPPGNLWDTTGLLPDSFYFSFLVLILRALVQIQPDIKLNSSSQKLILGSAAIKAFSKKHALDRVINRMYSIQTAIKN
jgi:hypothetical protein